MELDESEAGREQRPTSSRPEESSRVVFSPKTYFLSNF